MFLFVFFCFLLWFLFYLILICHFTFFFLAVLSSVVWFVFVQAILETMLSSRDTDAEKMGSTKQQTEMVSHLGKTGRERGRARVDGFTRVGLSWVHCTNLASRARPRFQLLSLTDAWRSVSGGGEGLRLVSKTPDHKYLFVYSFYTQLKVITVLL